MALLFFNNVSAPSVKGRIYEYDFFYVPVASFFQELKILFSELEEGARNGEIVILASDKDNLLKIFGESILNAEFVSRESLINYLDQGKIAILPWYETSSQFKTLSVDGVFLWDGHVIDYPLKIKIKTSNVNETQKNFDPQKIVKIVSTGDVILSRTVAVKMNELGVLSSWNKVKEFLRSADITFISLEAPFSDLYPPPKEGMSFIVPSRAIEGLKISGVDIVGLANNHSTNFGLSVFKDNLRLIEENGITYVGGGGNLSQAESPAIIEKNGLKFGFLSWNSIIGAIPATESNPGVAMFHIKPWYSDNKEDIEHLAGKIREVKQKVDVLLVQLHWGQEYQTNQSSSQIWVAHSLIDAGADLIIGTHPHTVQGLEFYNNHLITYSLGNFIFDQEWSQETKEGVILKSYFYQGKNVANQLFPIVINNYHQPQILTKEKGISIIERIKEASAGFSR